MIRGSTEEEEDETRPDTVKKTHFVIRANDRQTQTTAERKARKEEM